MVNMKDVFVVEDSRVLLQDSMAAAGAFKTQTFSKHGSPDLILIIKRCMPREIDSIMAIQKKIINLVPDKYSYIDTSKEDVEESLLHDICLGAYHGSKLIGFTILMALRESKRHLSHFLGYSEAHKRRCTTNDGTWIDPEYQGYGLQYWFSKEKDHIAKHMGAAELLACTSPINHASQHSLRKNGYSVVLKAPLYGGVERLIFSKMIPSGPFSAKNINSLTGTREGPRR